MLFTHKVQLVSKLSEDTISLPEFEETVYKDCEYYTVNDLRRNQDLKIWRKFSLFQCKSIAVCDKVQNGLCEIPRVPTVREF